MPKFRKLILIGLLLCAAFLSLTPRSFADEFAFTNSPPNNDAQKLRIEKTLAELKTYVPVTVFAGMDEIVEVDLTNLLLKNDIDSYCLGSLWYNLYVPPLKKEAASKIIADEAKRGLFKPLYKYDGAKLIGLSESDLLYSDSMADRPPLIKALFQCKAIQSQFGGFTYVKSIYTKKKMIWVTPDRQGVAYDGEITLLPKKGSESGCRVHFQIWDHEQQGISLGGSSWQAEVHPKE